MKRQRLSRNRSFSFDEEKDINPMEGVANLADVMLVLAVGMMLALIVAWNVDVFSTSPEATPVAAEEAVELTEEYDELAESDGQSDDSEELDEYGLTEYGKVYKDADGNLYLVGE